MLDSLSLPLEEQFMDSLSSKLNLGHACMLEQWSCKWNSMRVQLVLMRLVDWNATSCHPWVWAASASLALYRAVPQGASLHGGWWHEGRVPAVDEISPFIMWHFTSLPKAPKLQVLFEIMMVSPSQWMPPTKASAALSNFQVWNNPDNYRIKKVVVDWQMGGVNQRETHMLCTACHSGMEITHWHTHTSITHRHSTVCSKASLGRGPSLPLQTQNLSASV